ncbi:hypothetical protein LRS05_10295 [Flavobacterium sp. J372]|uniref:hypothetical protein n=1 Tax=Flavobacterium sp. J372 TaxID=2898436 RepID=UPI0021510CE7|nr:hypothetical protein [Flavobacterium sp. J372]MCR5862515.1 hypothetical protein [Flavobacterium sp. J372]
MITTTMFREGKQQEWSDKGVDVEKFYDEAAVYAMIMMMVNNDAEQSAINVIDRAKFLILNSKHN